MPLNDGSGKFGKPCWRIHRALTNISCTCSPVICGGAEPPGCSFAHAVWAETNAGDGVSSAPSPRMLNPPPGEGSGKFEIPCERIQSEYLTPCE